MTKKVKHDFKKLRSFLLYFLIAAGTILIAVFGSLNKKDGAVDINLSALAASNYNISVAQLSEFYIVASSADALNLASASDVAANYVTVTSLYESGQTSGGKIEKPTLPSIIADRGVITYVVQSGDTMSSIAAKHGLTTDQIRWSNGLRTTDIAVGDVLYLPSLPGIVYTVKADDTLALISAKYGSSVTEIIHLNDLEKTGIREGLKILIKNGTLPIYERPEHVSPRISFYYSYSGSAYSRQAILDTWYAYGLGGNYVAGQCTQWAWHKRQDLPGNLGNANTWAARAAAQGFRVDHIPEPGAIFQTSVGYYGHVGYVESVNFDGSITVTEMNYNYRSFQVIRAIIPANAVEGFFYIH